MAGKMMGGWWRAAGLAVAVLLVGAVCAGDTVAAPATPEIIAVPGYQAGAPGLGDAYLPEAGNGGYDVEHYDLGLRYDPPAGRLTGRATITAVATRNLSRFNLDFGALAISSLTVDGAATRWARGGGELIVTPVAGLPAGHRFTVDVRYDGQPGTGPEAERIDAGFIRGRAGAVALDEPTGAAEWYPVNDHPRDKASYAFAITVPDGMTAVANGVPAGRAPAAQKGWTTWRWREDEPMASYLATVAIGRYRLHIEPGNVVTAVADTLPQRVDAQLARTSEVVDFLAGVFGPYPFRSAGGIVPDEPRLRYALETQTRPVYASAYFDRDTVVGVMAHELTHQWFGDSVSVHDWRDIWLNEGFATYGQWLWSEHAGGPTVRADFDALYRDDDVFVPPPGAPGPDHLFTPSVYERGAMTLQALRMTVGDDAFFAILRGWAAERKYRTGTTAEFVALASRVAGRPLAPLLDAWLYEAGKPPRP